MSLQSFISEHLNENIKVFPTHSGKLITESNQTYFLKTGQVSKAFSNEAHGLLELKKAQAIKIVEPILHGENFILTEYVENTRPRSKFFQIFGKEFARMHRYTADQYGFYENNYIGATPQINIPNHEEKHDWIVFYFNKRLLFQYQLAEKNAYVSKEFKRNFLQLEKNIHRILKDSEESPSLLHGDLHETEWILSKYAD